MAKSLDGLIEFLLEEIAIGGERGLTFVQLAASVQEFYIPSRHRQDAATDDSRATILSGYATIAADRAFLSRIWTWLAKHPDVSIGQDHQYDHEGLDDIEKQFPGYTVIEENERLDKLLGRDQQQVDTAGNESPAPHNAQYENGPHLHVNNERVSIAICGHLPDPTRVFPNEWALLLHIAAAKYDGILQGALIKATGQDKRSVPKRTDALHQKGYIEKKILYVKGNKTSRLYLRRFARASASGAAIPMTETTGSTSSAMAPNQITVRHVARQFFELLKYSPLIPQEDLRDTLGMVSSGKARILSQIIRYFARSRCVKRIKTVSGTAASPQGPKVCIQYLREPGEEDWFYVQGQGLELDQHIELLASVHEADPLQVGTSPDDGNGGLLDEDQVAMSLENEELGQANRTILPQWNPDRTLANVLSETAFQAGLTGVKNVNVRNVITGPFIKRTLESALVKLSHRALQAQPENLRHLAILRTQELTGSALQYLHYAFEVYVEKVSNGHATWQGVSGGVHFLKDLHKAGKDESSITTAPLCDSFGFTVDAKPHILLTRNGEVDMPQLMQDAKVRVIRIRKGEPVLKKTRAGHVEIAFHKMTERTTRRDSIAYETPNKALKRKSNGEKTRATKQVNDAGEPIAGRPRKFTRGTEKYWRNMFSTIFQQQNPAKDESFKKVGYMNDPRVMEIFRGRPKNFDKAILQATEAGLPVPSEPHEIGQEWIDKITAVIDRSQPGIYISPPGYMLSSRRKRTQRLIFRSPRLSEIDWFDRERTWEWQYITSSAAHSIRYQRYYPSLETQKRRVKVASSKMSKAPTTVGSKCRNSDTMTPRESLSEPLAITGVDAQIQSRNQSLVETHEPEHVEVDKPVSDANEGSDCANPVPDTRHASVSDAELLSTPQRTRSTTPVHTSELHIVLPSKDSEFVPPVRRGRPPKKAGASLKTTNTKRLRGASVIQASRPSQSGDLLKPMSTNSITEAATEATRHTSFEHTIDPLLQDQASLPLSHTDVAEDVNDPANNSNNVGNVTTAPSNGARELDGYPDFSDDLPLSSTGPAPILPTEPHLTELSIPVNQSHEQPNLDSDILDRSHYSDSQTDTVITTAQSVSNPRKRPCAALNDLSEDLGDNIDPSLRDQTGPTTKPSKKDNTSQPKRSQVAKLCRLIILELIGLCSGLAPNVPWTFRRAMMPRWQEAGVRAEQLTVKNARSGLKALVANGKLKQITFAFRGKSGTMSKMSIVALQSMDAASPAVLDLQKKMTEIEPADYVPHELELEIRRVPAELDRKRYAEELLQEEHRDADSAHSESPQPLRGKDGQIFLSSRLDPLDMETSRSPSPPPQPVFEANIGFLTLSVPRLRELKIPDAHQFKYYAPSAPLRFDTGDTAAVQPEASSTPATSLKAGSRQKKRKQTNAGSRKLIRKKPPKFLLPSCLDKIPNIAICRDDAARGIDSDPDLTYFEAEVDCVSAWEENLVDQLDEAKTDVPIFINHSVPKGASGFLKDPSHIEFHAIIRYDDTSCQETETPFPEVESWPPFVSALRLEEAVVLASASAVKERRTRKSKKRKADDDNAVNDDNEGSTIPSTKRKKSKMKERPSRKSHRNRALGETNTDADTPSQIMLKRTRATQLLRHLSEEAKYQIVVAVIVVRVLAGGIEKFIDWQLVKRLAPDHTDHVLKESWKTMSTRYRTDITDLTENLQIGYIEALTEGDVPSIDFNAIYSADWEGIYSWALRNLDKSIIKSVENLPATRNELLNRNDYDFEEFKGVRELLGYNLTMTIPRKEEILSSAVFGKAFQTTTSSSYPSAVSSPMTLTTRVLAEEDESNEPLSRAKSWVMATLLTPEDSFIPSEVRKKLMKLGGTIKECESLLDKATKALQRDRLISRLKGAELESKSAQLHEETRFENFRRFEISTRFFEQFDFRRIVTSSMLRQAAAYKIKVLDTAFDKGEPVTLAKDKVLDDGEMVAIVNLIAMGMLRIDAQDDVPASRWGLEWEKHGYTTRLIDKKCLGFGIIFTPIKYSYVYGDPLSIIRSQSLIPRGEMDQPDDMGRIPLWFDINHSFQPKVWEMVTSTLIGLISIRPGLSDREMCRTLYNSISVWEARMVLDWCEKVGLLKKSPGGLTWETCSWWWMCLGFEVVWKSSSS